MCDVGMIYTILHIDIHCKPSTGPSSRSSCLKSPKYGTFEARHTDGTALRAHHMKGPKGARPRASQARAACNGFHAATETSSHFTHLHLPICIACASCMASWPSSARQSTLPPYRYGARCGIPAVPQLSGHVTSMLKPVASMLLKSCIPNVHAVVGFVHAAATCSYCSLSRSAIVVLHASPTALLADGVAWSLPPPCTKESIRIHPCRLVVRVQPWQLALHHRVGVIAHHWVGVVLHHWQRGRPALPSQLVERRIPQKWRRWAALGRRQWSAGGGWA
mmetsp:Transcript_21635/g.48721  ORF Transcript_21635/g.48721 Transcript_21635/m.48721 type:complete len:277 (-) Transcript_21635:19-849(-)